MKKTLIVLIIIIGIAFVSWLVIFSSKKAPVETQNLQPDILANKEPLPSSGNMQASSDFKPPLDRARERVAKKPFGLFVTPQNSPVTPEKFRGYHTGADFEIFPEELNADFPVRAVCSGKMEAKRSATGYGGVVVQACELEGQPIMVVYGHLRLSSVSLTLGADLKIGDTVGNLGTAYSTETGGERKHLHLGFHKGAAVNILGYVQNEADLSDWIDPCLFVCNN